jgi:tetratricopeptide (TPR) repeat protein
MIKIDPKYALGYVGIGNIFYQQKEYDSAVLNYRTAIALDSLNLNAYTFLSVCLFFKNEVDSSSHILKQLIRDKIAEASTFKIGMILSNYYQGKKLFDKEIDITQPLYNYDSAYQIPGIDSFQRRNLLNNLAYAYLFNRQSDLSKYYYMKGGLLDYYYYNMACLQSLDKKTGEALESLEFSFQNGYKNYDHLLEDTDFENLRNTEEFKQLIKKYFPDKVK